MCCGHKGVTSLRARCAEVALGGGARHIAQMPSSAKSGDRIALIGDLHSSWDETDVAYFNRSDYALLLFTGDLGASGPLLGPRSDESAIGVRRL